jgi:hypothetical protein
VESSSATPPTSVTGQIAAAPTITGTSGLPLQDASDCVDLADELAARFRLLQHHEEAAFIARPTYQDNLDELRVLLTALTAYVVAPPVAVNAW